MDTTNSDNKPEKQKTDTQTFSVSLPIEESQESIDTSTQKYSNLSKQELINFAFNYHGQGNTQKAITYYREFLQQGYVDPAVFSNYGVILRELGQLKEAELLTRKAIELKPDFGNAYCCLGNILSDLGKLEEAASFTRKAIELQPSEFSAFYNLGNICTQLGNVEEAEICLRKAIELNPNYEMAYVSLGNALFNLGKLEEAETSTRKAIELQPNLVTANYNLAIILKQLNNLEEAEIFSRKTIDLDKCHPDAYAHLGNILRDLGKLEDAEFSIRKAIELKPNFSESYSNLGAILKELGRLEEAKDLAEKAIELQPNLAEAHTNLATILKELGSLEEAEIFAKKAIKLKPNFSESYSNLGAILKESGRLEEAKDLAEKAIELQPNLAEPYFLLGIIAKDEYKFDHAELMTRKAIQLKPNYAEGYANLGAILNLLGKLNEAEIALRKSIELKSTYPDSYAHLGNILINLGKQEEAKISLIKAIELGTKLEITNFLLAELLYLEGNYKLAIKYLDGKTYGRSQSLYLACLMCLDREDEFHIIYDDLFKKGLCNAEIGGIIDHANIIYDKKNYSTFCNEAISYAFVDKIDEELFPPVHFNQLIDFFHSEQTEHRSQGTLHNGVQTAGNLFSLNYPFIKSIRNALENKIDLYKSKFKDSQEGFIKNWPKDYELRSWMIGMNSGGFLKQHNHAYGWITGSFYLQVPKYKNNDAGSLAFSYQGPQYPTKNKKFNLNIQRIEPRDICIFPSSLFHQTIPFESNEERICFVFDLVQRK